MAMISKRKRTKAAMMVFFDIEAKRTHSIVTKFISTRSKHFYFKKLKYRSEAKYRKLILNCDSRKANLFVSEKFISNQSEHVFIKLMYLQCRHVQEQQRLLQQYFSNVINIETKTNESFDSESKQASFFNLAIRKRNERNFCQTSHQRSKINLGIPKLGNSEAKKKSNRTNPSTKNCIKQHFIIMQFLGTALYNRYGTSHLYFATFSKYEEYVCR